MSEFWIIVLAAWLAGITAFIGGVLAKIEGSAETVGKREAIHGIVAFGGGILIAAVAFALVPEATAALPPAAIALTFCAGGIIFCALDAAISRHVGSKAQFMTLLLDFIPESIALGAVFGHSPQAGILLALFIGAQNLPEGFNAYRENRASDTPVKPWLPVLLAVSLLGPASASAGYLLLHDLPVVTAVIMSLAGGGILYLVFQDIAPKSKMSRHWTPPLGAVLGFVTGIVGKQLLG